MFAAILLGVGLQLSVAPPAVEPRIPSPIEIGVAAAPAAQAPAVEYCGSS